MIDETKALWIVECLMQAYGSLMKAFVEHNKVTFYIQLKRKLFNIFLQRDLHSYMHFSDNDDSFSLVIFHMDSELIHGLFLHIFPSLLRIFRPYLRRMKTGVAMVVAKEEMVNVIIELGLMILQNWLLFPAKLRMRGLLETEKLFCFTVNLLILQYLRLLMP